MSGGKELLFVSTRFLFPVDSGGKIRTTQVLRGLKGGEFRIILASPATAQCVRQWQDELENVCDEFQWWGEPKRWPLFRYTRLRYLFSKLPVPVRTDQHPAGIELVGRLLKKEPDVVVFDFAHSGALMPADLQTASLVFTHNVEAEIFRRHFEVADNPITRAIWKNQYRKMIDFEGHVLGKFDVVVAVADRDSDQFVSHYRVTEPFVIPTGVDLEFFRFSEPALDRKVVFLGSMDWMANQDGIRWFMDEVWSHIQAKVTDASMTVVGRSPPVDLVREARRRGLAWTFTGFVDDVRPHVEGSAVSVIPLRVGGGTRLKVYEAMAMGSPIVSTSIGVEGLPVQRDRHFLEANDPHQFAEAVVSLLTSPEKRVLLARKARSLVEEEFSFEVASRAFEEACNLAISRWSNGPAEGIA